MRQGDKETKRQGDKETRRQGRKFNHAIPQINLDALLLSIPPSARQNVLFSKSAKMSS